jgi:hypothetical protein
MGRRVRQLRQESLLQLDLLFGSFLPPGLLAQAEQDPHSREQIYSLRRTFFGFLGAYCQARARLPLDILQRLRCAVAARAVQAEELWLGLRIKVIDGTGLSTPDTRKNQRAYPQSSEQKPGCGFPWMKLVGVFSLGSGVLLDYARGNKHQHELKLLQGLLDLFKPGDLALADRGFSSYTLLGLLYLRQVPALFRLHHARSGDLRRGKRLGKQDRLVVWQKPQDWQRRYLPLHLWRRIPAELAVRILRFDLRRAG